jgi:hypothetical protein
MNKLGIRVLLYTIMLASNASIAQPLDQQAIAALTTACQADALQLCSWNSVVAAVNGNNREIIACFRQSRPYLSMECRAAIARYVPR